MVTVNFKTGSNINVAIDGVALMQGNIGDFIQVKNKRFNKIYTGEVVGINQVLVQI
jgi:flagella basal body P-ring formation protein FlgA